jgi:hypothetical protein
MDFEIFRFWDFEIFREVQIKANHKISKYKNQKLPSYFAHHTFTSVRVMGLGVFGFLDNSLSGYVNRVGITLGLCPAALLASVNTG